METHIVVNGQVVNTIRASVEEACVVYPDAVCLDASAGGKIGDIYDGNEFIAPPPIELDLVTLKTRLASGIDDRVAEVYNRWFRFDAEYTAREAAARTFAAAAFVGEPEVWVTAFANSSGKDYRSAAELIIAQADMLRAALLQLGALRMEKYKVLGAPDLESAQLEQRQILDQINLIAEGL